MGAAPALRRGRSIDRQRRLEGAPADGAAELGYAVAPARQGRGVATAVVRELVRRARIADLQMVFAYTLAAESASTSVLARCGFTRVVLCANYRPLQKRGGSVRRIAGSAPSTAAMKVLT